MKTELTDKLLGLLDSIDVDYNFNQTTKMVDWKVDGSDESSMIYAIEVNGGLNVTGFGLTPEQVVSASICEREIEEDSIESTTMSDDDILKSVGATAIYEQLAEEACELAHAALKKARIFRGENPTPDSLDKVNRNLVEELGDVMLVADILGLTANAKQMDEKKARWIRRISDSEER